MGETESQKKKRAERKRQWRIDHPEEAKALDKKYNHVNPERRKAIKKTYNENHKEEAAMYRKNNSKTRAEYNKQWRKDNPEKAAEYDKRNNLKKCFSMTLEQYQELFDSQNCVCAICNQPEQAKGKSLSVDHDHGTGTIRGLLCQNCNTAIGKLQDSVEILQSAIKYLQETKTSLEIQKGV